MGDRIVMKLNCGEEVLPFPWVIGTEDTEVHIFQLLDLSALCCPSV